MTAVKPFRKRCNHSISLCFVVFRGCDTGLTPKSATKGRDSGGRRLGWWLAAAGSIVWMTGPDGWWRLPD